MNAQQQLMVAMYTRVWDFVRAHPFGDDVANAVTAKFGEQLGRLQVLIGRQVEGRVTRRAESARHSELRRRITRSPLRHLAGISRGLGEDQARLAAVLSQSLSHAPRTEFLAVVRAILAEVEASTGVLRGVGMSEETVPDLRALLVAYEAALAEANSGRRAHVGARADLKVVLRELRRTVRQLDGMVTYRHRDNAELLAMWESARNVAWPVPLPVKPVARAPAEGRTA